MAMRVKVPRWFGFAAALAVSAALAASAPASASAWVAELRGYTVYVMDPAGTFAPNSWPYGTPAAVGNDLFGGSMTRKEIISMPATAYRSNDESRVATSGSTWRNVWQGAGGVSTWMATIPFPVAGLADGAYWVGVVRSITFHQTLTTTWRPTGVSGYGASVRLSGSEQVRWTQGVGVQYAYSPEWATTAGFGAGAGGWAATDAWLAVRRVGANYHWGRFVGSRISYGTFSASASVFTTGTAMGVTPATTHVMGGGAVDWTHHRATDGANVASIGDQKLRQSQFLGSATTTHGAVYDLLMGASTNTTGWAVARENERNAQDRFFQGVDDLPVTVVNTTPPPVIPSFDASASMEASGLLSGINPLDPSTWNEPLTAIRTRIVTMLAGLSEFFWWAPFFQRRGW